jgi:hypothetical protein
MARVLTRIVVTRSPHYPIPGPVTSGVLLGPFRGGHTQESSGSACRWQVPMKRWLGQKQMAQLAIMTKEGRRPRSLPLMRHDVFA